MAAGSQTAQPSAGGVPAPVAVWLAARPAQPERWWRELPFESLLAHVQARGKQFLDGALLDQLVVARDALPRGEEAARARSFLRMLVDRHTDTYCYDSYLGMDFILELADPQARDFAEHVRRRGAQLVSLLADIVWLECRTYLGREERFQERVPSYALGHERIRYAIASLRYFTPLCASELRPHVAFLVNPDADHGEGPRAAWLQANMRASAGLLQADGASTRTLFELAAIPMSRDHDEYMFIRVVQLFELCFNIVVRGLEDAIRALEAGALEVATACLWRIVEVMRGSGGLFRVLTTMTPESFLAFRPYTSGSSAVASRQIKHVEILCQRPPEARLASEAFELVPSVVAQYRAGVPSLETTLPDVLASATPARARPLLRALEQFDSTWVSWKKAHFGIAMRWLGAEKGTGGTEGIPYLRRYVADPLLPFLRTVGSTGANRPSAG